MNNHFITAALLVIAIAQGMQAYQGTKPPPEQIHFLALQHYCKDFARQVPAPDAYFACMAKYAARRS